MFAFLTSSPRRFWYWWSGNHTLPNTAECTFGIPRVHGLSWAQSMLSINTCWSTASDDTEMKYKGKMKCIKDLIRHTAWFSLGLSSFPWCLGHAGTVLIVVASVLPEVLSFSSTPRFSPFTLSFLDSFLAGTLIIANRALRINMWISQRHFVNPLSFLILLCLSTQLALS